MKLLDDLKDRRGYCELKEEALDRTVWRNRFAKGFGPVVWQITGDDDLHYDGKTVPFFLEVGRKVGTFWKCFSGF